MSQQPFDAEAIAHIREQIKAEYETAAQLKRQNDLAQEALETSQRLLTTESTRNKLWLEIAEKTANFIHQIPELTYLLHSFDEKLGEYGEALEQLDERIGRIEYGIMLILAGKGNGNKIKAETLIKDIELERQKKLLSELYSTLHDLELQKAKALAAGLPLEDLGIRMTAAKKELIRVQEYLHELGYKDE